MSGHFCHSCHFAVSNQEEAPLPWLMTQFVITNIETKPSQKFIANIFKRFSLIIELLIVFHYNEEETLKKKKLGVYWLL